MANQRRPLWHIFFFKREMSPSYKHPCLDIHEEIIRLGLSRSFLFVFREKESTFREEQKCKYRSLIQGYICKQTDQVDQDHIRLIHEMPGNEATLKAIADSRAKRKRNCPMNQRVESLGAPSEPWAISVSLEGTSDSVLKGANFTARSRPFAILPVTMSERSTIILAASTCSVVSWLALCCLVCCWFKKSKSRKIKSEEISESQSNDQKNNSHVSSKHQGSQVETGKEDTVMGEDMRMKVMLGQLNQLPHQSLNGVSRRKVSRRAVGEEHGSREEAAVPAPSITRVMSHGHTCAPGSAAQQVYVQETGNWKEAREQLLSYQLAGQDQLLLLYQDIRRERQQVQGQRTFEGREKTRSDTLSSLTVSFVLDPEGLVLQENKVKVAEILTKVICGIPISSMSDRRLVSNFHQLTLPFNQIKIPKFYLKED
ncbi:hypothetical protein HPG69_002535 [Diceros bicornis minor]|uniref:Uncharacterized protein n=1 Tax=Diceros bicornis minor TaxID=77932 RepID=A0A7J7FNZ9_DICBM|nr:hypothetical protein HPG69_002535 [Diceros bicornis minor]